MHVLLIEDDQSIANGICLGLSAQGAVIDTVGNVSQAKVMLKQHLFDAAILDLNLPDADGLTLLRWLRSQQNPIPVLILTARDSIDDKVAGLHCGADDYLLKPFDLRELMARLQALLRRHQSRPTHALTHGNIQYDPIACQAYLDGIEVNLSRREQALLHTLLNNPKRVFSSEQLKDALYGTLDDIESNALNVHIFNLRKKLGPGVIDTVRGLGYRLGDKAGAI